jgi:hypothetical protein
MVISFSDDDNVVATPIRFQPVTVCAYRLKICDIIVFVIPVDVVDIKLARMLRHKPARNTAEPLE